jgi:hypothetical protein
MNAGWRWFDAPDCNIFRTSGSKKRREGIDSMNRFRSALAGSGAALAIGTATMVSPASAQGGCGQSVQQGGGHIFTLSDSNQSQSDAHLIGLIKAAIQNLDVTTPVTVEQLGANVSVVCLTNTLNGDDTRILNGILNDVDVLNDSQFLNGLSVLSGVNVLAVDTRNNTIYVVSV